MKSVFHKRAKKIRCMAWLLILVFIFQAFFLHGGPPVKAEENIRLEEETEEIVGASAQPYEGCVWVTMNGYYETSDTLQQEILDEVNRIRYEACREGIINPNTGNPLTLSDYNEVKWSSNLEVVSLLRAAEVVYTIGHTRPCSGSGSIQLAYKDYPLRPSYECLAWNWTGLMGGISQWYSEKSIYEADPRWGSDTGHYIAMIDPDVNYIGFSSYYSTAGRYRYNIAGEFSDTYTSQDSAFLAAAEPANANISVKETFITGVTVSDTGVHPVTAQIAPGETTQLQANVGFSFTYSGTTHTGKGPLAAGGTWASSDPAVAAVSDTGLVTAMAPGTADITCTVNGITDAWTLTVDGISSITEPEMVKTASGTAPVLPETVEAGWLLGGTTEESVTWESPLPATYRNRAGGTYKVEGYLTSYPDISVQVQVETAQAYVTTVTGYATSVTTESGTHPALSETAILLWSNGEQETKGIYWPEIPREYYSMREGGSFTATGSVIAIADPDPETYTSTLITLNCAVTVNEAMIISIAAPEAIETFTGHAPAGFPETVSVSWSNGDESEEAVTWNHVSAADYSQSGTFTVKGVVEGTSLMAEQTVLVTDPKVTAIEWVEEKIPRSDYIVGQSLELKDNMILAVLEDGSREYVPVEDLIISGYDPQTVGDQLVSFTYVRDGSWTLNLRVNVREKRLVSVVWDTLPAKLDYVEGQLMDISGGVLLLTYDDDSTETFETDNSILGSRPVLEYTGTMEVQYFYIDPVTGEDFSCPFEVTVAERSPVETEILELPDKLTYVEGDPVDLSGGSIQVTYNDGTKVTLPMTAGTVHVKNVTAEPGQQTVTVYVLTTENETVEASFSVTFREKRKPEAEADIQIWGENKAFSVSCPDTEELQEILLDGTALSPADYILEDGCIILSEELMQTITEGEHTLEMVWEDEKASVSFETIWPFADVDITSGSWYVEPIRYIYSRGIMTGIGKISDYAPGEAPFGRKDNIRRRDFAVIIYRLAGEPSVAGLENPFLDVPQGKYYTDAVIWAYDSGVITGTSPTTFEPAEFITREQIALMLQRYAAFLGEDVTGGSDLFGFPDVNLVHKWSGNAMNWAVEQGIITGKERNAVFWLDPRASATRGECAAMIMRFLEREAE